VFPKKKSGEKRGKVYMLEDCLKDFGKGPQKRDTVPIGKLLELQVERVSWGGGGGGNLQKKRQKRTILSSASCNKRTLPIGWKKGARLEKGQAKRRIVE